MFYSQDILQKRGGKFGIIWIAATNPKRLTRRDYARVNVKKSSEDIIDYILVKVPPLKAGGHFPRLSLYLSAQLMLGVIRCHGKQVEILLGDVTEFLGRVRLIAATSSTFDIDLKATSRSDYVTTMDVAAVSGIQGVAFNPYFGTWSDADQTMELQDVEGWRMKSIVESSSSPSVQMDVALPTTPKRKQDLPDESFRPVLGSPHTVSSPDDIKMKEVLHQMPDVEIPGIQELPGLDGEDLRLPDAPPEADILLEQLLSPRKESSLSEIEPLLPMETTPVQRPETGVPPQRREPRSPGVTPAPEKHTRRKRPSLTMELIPITPSPVQRKRRKQLLFADIETQIPKNKLRHQLLTGSDTCIPFILPNPRPSTVEELFRRPGGKALMHPKLLPLWKRNARVEEISETESETNNPIWTVPELSSDESVRDINLFGSPVIWRQTSEEPELPAPVLEGSLEILRAEDESLISRVAEISDIEMTRAPSRTSVDSMHRSGRDSPLSMERAHSISRDKSLGDHSIEELDQSLLVKRTSREEPICEDGVQPEVQVEESLSIGDHGSLYVVQEEREDVLSPKLPRVIESSSDAYSTEIIGLISSNTESTPVTTFKDICPTNKPRHYAARMFSELLVLGKNCQVCLQQDEPFEDIYISRGAAWEMT